MVEKDMLWESRAAHSRFKESHEHKVLVGQRLEHHWNDENAWVCLLEEGE